MITICQRFTHRISSLYTDYEAAFTSKCVRHQSPSLRRSCMRTHQNKEIKSHPGTHHDWPSVPLGSDVLVGSRTLLVVRLKLRQEKWHSPECSPRSSKSQDSV